jgi:hypothetical protein
MKLHYPTQEQSIAPEADVSIQIQFSMSASPVWREFRGGPGGRRVCVSELSASVYNKKLSMVAGWMSMADTPTDH